MGIVVMLILGLVVGAIARFVMPGREPIGLLLTMLLGLAGAVVAGIVGTSLGWYRVGQIPGIIASVLGAIMLIALYRAIRPRPEKA
jgi:uncharacterized membrane protein YeaQ/YmgE (transglycosylase-associated protein family)